jgi:hypothetical protein
MRRDPQRLNDILEALDWIANTVGGQTEADFLADETLCYAFAQKLTIVDEAVAQLSPGNHCAAQLCAVAGYRWTAEHSGFTSTSAFIGRLFGRPRFDHAPVLRGQIAEILKAEFSE